MVNAVEHTSIDMINQQKIRIVLDSLNEQNISISQFICNVLKYHEHFTRTHTTAVEDLFANAANTMIALMCHPRNAGATDEIVHHFACELYSREIKKLSGPDSTLKFNAKHAQAHQVDRFNSEELMRDIYSMAPRLWALSLRLISADGLSESVIGDRNREKLKQINVMFLISRIVQSNNQRCNLLGTIIGIFLHTCNTPERVIDMLGRSSASISASAVTSAINSLSASAEQQLKEAGGKFMYSYVLDNFDVQLKHKETTVEQSQENLFHLTSASLVRLEHTTLDDLKQSDFLWQRSKNNDKNSEPVPRPRLRELFGLHREDPDENGMNARLRFNAWKFMVDICTYGPPYFHSFLKDLKGPEAIEQIPITKTYQIPARSMHNSNSTVEGNIKSVNDLMAQCGIDDTGDYIIPFHGDLGTYERFRTAMMERSIEDTPLRRMQYVVFIPGLFHTEMACANALYKLFLEKKAGHTDETSLYNIIEVLYPLDSGRISNNKGSFQMISGCIEKAGISDRLECWRTYVSSTFPNCNTLDSYAQKCPTLENLIATSRELAKAYSNSSLQLEVVRRKALTERDQQYENVLKRIEYFLLFEETQYALRHGDIGQVETCLITWIPIYRATGKHKYAAMLTEFLLNVHSVFPEGLRKAVRYNWLCNMKGTADGFRGVNWLLELNNLLTKVIYGGKGSNHTVERIIKESILIQLYRDCKHVIEEQFLLTPKTMQHGRPDFVRTFTVLSQLAIQSSLLKPKAGRESGYHVPDAIQVGLAKFSTDQCETDDQDEFMDTEDADESFYEVTPTADVLYD